MHLYGIVEIVTVSTFIVTAAIAITVTIKNKQLPDWIKYFYLYPLVGVLDGMMIILSVDFHLIPTRVMNMIDNCSLLFHFSFLSFIIGQKLERKGVMKYFGLFRILFSGLIIVLLVLLDSTKFNNIAYGTTNTSLFVICLIFFIQLVRQDNKGSLLKDPFFWVLNGIFLGMGIGIPIQLTIAYFRASLSFDTFAIIAALSPFAYFIMYIFFIKAYIVLIKNSRIKKISSS